MSQKYFGETTLLRTQVYDLHKAVSENCEIIENMTHAYDSTSANADTSKK